MGAKILQKMREGPCWDGVWPHLDPWDVVRLRTSSSVWSVPAKYGPHAELLFFLKKEPLTLTKAVVFEPFVPAETLKSCALIGLHLTAGGSARGSSGGQSLNLGHMWRYGCPESPEWDGDCESCSESEDLSSSDFREHNVEGLALHVIGLNWSGEKVSLFLEDRELARALSCHVALDMLCQEMHEAWKLESPLSQRAKAFLPQWTGSDRERRGMWCERK